MSSMVDSSGTAGFTVKEFTPLTPLGLEVKDLAEDFVAHLALVYFLDCPEDIRELANAGAVLDEMLARVPLYDYERVKDYFDWPLVDIFELVDCIGLDGIEEVLAWSLITLEGRIQEPSSYKNLVKVFADCVGWNTEPSDPQDLASLVFLSTIAVYNKTLSNIGE
ncbi:MAG: hypothetical protein F7B59_04300 [Desulfurococcales archaeon]|nr:hypothetical protein [Desulfurococcales archaeon]